MKKLKFTLKNNDKKVIDEEINYSIEESGLLFEFNDWKFSINYGNENLYFKKESNEDVLEIVYSKEKSQGSITLKEGNMIFDLPLDSFKYKCSDDYIHFSYKILGEEESSISIMIIFKK